MALTPELAVNIISETVPSIPPPPVHPDSFLGGLVWLAAIVAAAFAIGVPVRSYLRRDRREAGADQVAGAMNDASSVLYNHLSDQISQYRIIADQAFKERNALIERVARLEERTSVLEETREALDRMKIRLEEKDQKLEESNEQVRSLVKEAASERAEASAERSRLLDIILSKDIEISHRGDLIAALDDRLRELELRLASSPEFCCPMLPKTPTVEG